MQAHTQNYVYSSELRHSSLSESVMALTLLWRQAFVNACCHMYQTCAWALRCAGASAANFPTSLWAGMEPLWTTSWRRVLPTNAAGSPHASSFASGLDRHAKRSRTEGSLEEGLRRCSSEFLHAPLTPKFCVVQKSATAPEC